MDFKQLTLNRFTVHKIFSKKDLRNESSEPYAEEAIELCKLKPDGFTTLSERIVSTALQKRRFFELELFDIKDDSFWSIGNKIFNSSLKDFLKIANKIAEKAAEAHSKGNIPGGLLLVAECSISSHPCLAIIKAEKSNAFSLSGSNMELIRDIFLSSDRALYKIGFLVKSDKKNNDPKSYKCYVYDDSFSSQKEDLTNYFYSTFLGFSTENNSKIQTNNFYKYIKTFTEEFIEGFGNQNQIMGVIDKDIISNRKKIIHPDDYIEYFPQELHEHYESMVASQLPSAIIKDTSVLSDIQTKRIKVNSNATLVAKNGIGNEVVIETLDGKDFLSTRKTLIDTGKKFKAVLIPNADINDTTKENGAAPKKKAS